MQMIFMPQWVDEFNLSGKQAKSVNGMLLGKVLEVQNNYVLIEDESKFFIPAYLIEKYEGGILWFKIDEDDAKSKFIVATAPS
jgi:hypothetical protein